MANNTTMLQSTGTDAALPSRCSCSEHGLLGGIKTVPYAHLCIHHKGNAAAAAACCCNFVCRL